MQTACRGERGAASVVKTAGMERGSAHSVLQRRRNF
jgi:hypothetical protein